MSTEFLRELVEKRYKIRNNLDNARIKLNEGIPALYEVNKQLRKILNDEKEKLEGSYEKYLPSNLKE